MAAPAVEAAVMRTMVEAVRAVVYCCTLTLTDGQREALIDLADACEAAMPETSSPPRIPPRRRDHLQLVPEGE